MLDSSCFPDCVRTDLNHFLLMNRSAPSASSESGIRGKLLVEMIFWSPSLLCPLFLPSEPEDVHQQRAAVCFDARNLPYLNLTPLHSTLCHGQIRLAKLGYREYVFCTLCFVCKYSYCAYHGAVNRFEVIIYYFNEYNAEIDTYK